MTLQLPPVESTRSSTEVTLPRVNLLPPELREAQRLRHLQAGLAAGVLAAVGLVAVLTVLAGGSVDRARADLETASAARTALDTEIAALAPIRAVYAEVEAAEATLAQATGSEIAWSRYLNDLSVTIPDGVWVDSMTVTGPAAPTAPAAAPDPAAPVSLGTVAFSGRGLSHDDVADWLEALAAQPGYLDPTFSTSEVDDTLAEPTVRFDSTVTIGPEALVAAGAR